jgi:hypothetical protein
MQEFVEEKTTADLLRNCREYKAYLITTTHHINPYQEDIQSNQL